MIDGVAEIQNAATGLVVQLRRPLPDLLGPNADKQQTQLALPQIAAVRFISTHTRRKNLSACLMPPTYVVSVQRGFRQEPFQPSAEMLATLTSRNLDIISFC